MTKRKPKPPPAPPAEAAPPVAPSAALVTVPIEVDTKLTHPWWAEDERREKALELAFGGASKKIIAEKLGVHRNTVSNWFEASQFREALAHLHGDRLSAMRARRAVQTSNFADRLANLADKTLSRIEKHAATGETIPLATRQELRDFMAEFRLTRAEERVDSGDNVTKVQHGHVHAVFGQVTHTQGVRAGSFKDFVHAAINANVIDVEALETSAEEPIVALVERIITDTDVLDVIAEEDRAAERAAMEQGK